MNDQEDWRKKYTAALMERNRTLQELKIEEAHKAVVVRMKEGERLGEEWHRLESAIKILNHLRDRI